jgi:hypothetical protein
VVAALAVAAGIFFRFWELGGAPLAVDEYFFGTSILNIAERGWPGFDCGGLYTRGVLVQYLTVPLLWLGAELEFATRFWPAVASLISIVAVWRIARLAGGILTAAIAATLVSLSVWEIEFARFGRMYSPFQAVFLWYVYFQILHLARGSNKARWAYLTLSALSILVYAGSSFLLAFNFLAVVWPGKRWSVSHLIVAIALLAVGAAFFMTDSRHLGVPTELVPPTAVAESGPALPLNIPDTPDFPLLIAVLGLFFFGSVLLRYRSVTLASHPSILYWMLTVLSFCFGFFALGFGLMIAALLLRLPFPVESTRWTRSHAYLSLLVLLAIWSGVLIALFSLDSDGSRINVQRAMDYMFNYPDLYHFVVRPWLQAIPVTTVLLALLAAPQLWILLSPRHQPESEGLATQRYIAASLILLFMLAALFRQPYTITRYTYFLYPLLLVFTAASIVHWSSSLLKDPRLRAVGMFAPFLLLCVLAEDFRLNHLIRINDPEFRYRTSYEDKLAEHYYIRWDFRAAALFVNERLAPDDSVIVFDQPLPHYLKRTSGIYIPEGSNKQSMVSGCGGKFDLWSNKPLLDTADVYDLIQHTRGDVWLIVRTAAYRFRDPLESSLPERYNLEPEYETQDGHLAVFRVAVH